MKNHHITTATTAPRQLLDSSSTAPRHLLDISSTAPRQLLDSSLTAPRQLLDSSWLPVPLGCPESCFTALTSPYYDSSFTAPLQLASYYDSCFTALTSPYYDSSFTAPLQLASYCESFLQLLLHHTTTAPLQLLYTPTTKRAEPCERKKNRCHIYIY